MNPVHQRGEPHAGLLADDVVRRPMGERVALWQPRIGRGAVVVPETIAAADAGDLPEPVRRRFADLGLLRDTVFDVSSAWLVIRPDVVLLPTIPAIWAPDPWRPGAGGSGYVEHLTDNVGAALILLLEEPLPVADVARRVRLPVVELVRRLAPWMSLETQIASLHPRRPRGAPPAIGPPRPPAPRRDDHRDDAGTTSLAGYHLREISDADAQFDDHETTVAHALALPHPVLGGVPFGAKLRASLGDAVHGTIVEVGCGTGELARAFSADLPPGSRYMRVDLSPALIRHQGHAAPRTRGVLGDAMHLPFRDGCVDLLVSNEVLADLPANLDADVVNVGACRFVAEIHRVLRPGGVAWLSEFGDPDAAPEEAAQLDHPEVSIRFDDLVDVARAMGLVARVVPLAEWLGADLSALHLSRWSWYAVRARSRHLGVRVPARAYTPDSVPLPEPIEGLRFVPSSEPGPGPLITRFYCLYLVKSA